jgi:hypothetical protein
VAENKDVVRWLMVEDTVLFQQTALAVGEKELESLVDHFVGKSRLVEAANAKYSV